jgi:hypothetical protein
MEIQKYGGCSRKLERESVSIRNGNSSLAQQTVGDGECLNKW